MYTTLINQLEWVRDNWDNIAACKSEKAFHKLTATSKLFDYPNGYTLSFGLCFNFLKAGLPSEVRNQMFTDFLIAKGLDVSRANLSYPVIPKDTYGEAYFNKFRNFAEQPERLELLEFCIEWLKARNVAEYDEVIEE